MDFQRQVKCYQHIERLLNDAATLPISNKRAMAIVQCREAATDGELRLLEDAVSMNSIEIWTLLGKQEGSRGTG